MDTNRQTHGGTTDTQRDGNVAREGTVAPLNLSAFKGTGADRERQQLLEAIKATYMATWRACEKNNGIQPVDEQYLVTQANRYLEQAAPPWLLKGFDFSGANGNINVSSR